MTTKIEWTHTTWNPVRGCSRVSEGCRNCYAERQAVRQAGEGGAYEGLAKSTAAGPRWTGDVRLIPGKLAEPLRWRKPRRCFVNSMSDLFHEGLAFEEIAAVFGVMAACPDITFQVLTKRPELARKWFSAFGAGAVPSVHCAGHAASRLGNDALSRVFEAPREELPWPLPNLHLGISAENQETFDARWPHLRDCPAAVRFWSYEPALGPVDTRTALQQTPVALPAGVSGRRGPAVTYHPRLDWVIAGGESGPGARPPHPEWFRDVRDQCTAAGVPFFFKQWGEWLPWDLWEVIQGERPRDFMRRVGKRKAGRLLDGREWNEFPEASCKI